MIIGLNFYVVQHVFVLLGKLNYYWLLIFGCKSIIYRMCELMCESEL